MLTNFSRLIIGDRSTACRQIDTHGFVHMKILGKIERLFLILGLLLGVVFGTVLAYRAISSRAELRRFQNLQREHSVATKTSADPASVFGVDFSLWSPNRITAYQQSLQQYFPAPLAVLRISKVHLEVPVLEGTDDLALNRGVGHITGTVRPGENGNIGIAGHRDGFFRALKDVGPGDVIELATPERTDSLRSVMSTFAANWSLCLMSNQLFLSEVRTRAKEPFSFSPRKKILSLPFANSSRTRFSASARSWKEY